MLLASRRRGGTEQHRPLWEPHPEGWCDAVLARTLLRVGGVLGGQPALPVLAAWVIRADAMSHNTAILIIIRVTRHQNFYVKGGRKNG